MEHSDSADKEWNGVSERRENPTCFLHQSTIKDMKNTIDDLEKENKASSDFQAQVKLAGIVSLALIASAFIYPTLLVNSVIADISEHQKQADQEYAKFHRMINDNQKHIYGMQGEDKVMMTNISMLIERIDRLTEVLENNDGIQKVYIVNPTEDSYIEDQLHGE